MTPRRPTLYLLASLLVFALLVAAAWLGAVYGTPWAPGVQP